VSMKKPKSSQFSGSRETFLIFIVVACGIMATLSVNLFNQSPSDPSEARVGESTNPEQPKSPSAKGPSVELTDVPLATGTEPLEKLFVQSGCAVCHTIPGIAPALGREGPRLVLGTNGPLRLADPQYQGTATTVREYVQESILNPGAYVVPGYSDRVMPRWYGKRLNALALDRMAEYLESVKE
jgi:mono/diheme cytochrome c family protein